MLILSIAIIKPIMSNVITPSAIILIVAASQQCICQIRHVPSDTVKNYALILTDIQNNLIFATIHLTILARK